HLAHEYLTRTGIGKAFFISAFSHLNPFPERLRFTVFGKREDRSFVYERAPEGAAWDAGHEGRAYVVGKTIGEDNRRAWRPRTNSSCSPIGMGTPAPSRRSICGTGNGSSASCCAA